MKKPKKKEYKEYTVNVVYTMIHTMYVEASSKREAEAQAMEDFHNETDFMDDEIDEVLRARVVEQ